MRAIGFFNTQLKEVDIEKCAMFDCRFKSVSFEDVYIYSSNLDDSALRESNFSDVSLQNVSGAYSVCPEEGSFIGFKKLCDKERYKTLICKLEIPADAKRSSAFSRKCRCSKAKVLEILDMDNENKFTIPVKKGYSTHKPAFEYKVGEMVYPPYKFPEKFPLKLRMRDLLEDTVDEKFYLSQEQINKIKFSTYETNKRRIQEKDWCDTL